MTYFLSREALARGLDESLAAMEHLVQAAGSEGLTRPTSNPRWTVRDTFAHLAASGRGLLATVERFLAGNDLPEGFSLDYWNERQVQKRAQASVEVLVEEVRAAHARAKAMLARLSDEDLAVRGTHPAGSEISVAGVFHLIAQHELAHLADVADALGVDFPYHASWTDPFRKDRLWWRLEDVRAQVKALAASLSPAQWQTPVYDLWAARDVIAHLAAAEKGHVDVGWALLRGDSTEIPGFDLDAYNNRSVDERRHLSEAELLAELDEARARTAELLAAVGPDDWEKGGPHPGGFDVTVEGIFKVIAMHERRHLRDLRKALAGGNGRAGSREAGSTRTP